MSTRHDMLKKISSFSIITAMLLSLLPLQFSTVSAAPVVTELVPYSTFNTIYSDDAGVDQGGAQVFGAPVAAFWKPEAVGGNLSRISDWADEGNDSGSRVLTQTSSNSTGDLHKYMRLYATPITGLAAPYQIMGKARMNLTASTGTNASIEFGLSTGGTSKLRLVRVNTSGTSNNISINNNDGTGTTNSRTLNNIPRGTWVDTIFVINVLADGVNAAATYYIDGVKYTTKTDGSPFNMTKANIDATTSARFAFIAGGSAKVDDAGVYAISGGSLPFTVNSLTNATDGATTAVDPNGSIILNFSNEIYKDAFILSGSTSRISIGGTAVTMDRTKVRQDQKSIEILAPAGGYIPGSTNQITINNTGLTDIFGTELTQANGLSFTIAGNIEPFTVSSFHGGVVTDVATDAQPTIAFSTNVAKANFSGKLTIQRGAEAAVVIPDTNLEQLDAKTIKITGYTFDVNTQYTVTIADTAADNVGTAISGQTSFSFTTAAAATVYPFTVASFNGGVAANVAIDAQPTITFSTNVEKANLSGKLTLQKGTDAPIVISDANIVQVNTKTVRLIGYTFDISTNYQVSISDTAIDDVGTAISGTRSFNFTTAAAAMERYEDYETMLDNYKPVNNTAKGFYYADRSNMNVISADGKKYLRTKADSLDQNVGVRAPAAFSSYANKVLFNSRIKLTSGSSDSYARVRMNTNDANHVHLVLFQGNKVGILDYPGSSKDILSGQNWAYKDNIWYDLSIILNLSAATPLMSVYVTGEDGTSFKKENIQMLEANLTGTTGTTVVQDWVTAANSVYFYSNNKTDGMDMLIDNMGLAEVGAASFKNITPADHATDVDTNSILTVSFNNPIKTGGVTAVLKSEDGSTIPTYPIAFINNSKSIAIQPKQALQMGTGYTLSLTGITDYTGQNIAFTDSEFTTKSWSLFAKHLSFSPSSLASGTITASFTAQNRLGTPKEVTIIIVQCTGTTDNYMVKKTASSKIVIPAGTVSQTISSSIDITDAQGSFVQVFVWDMGTYEPIMFMPKLLQ